LVWRAAAGVRLAKGWVEPNPPDGGTVWIFARVRVPVS